MSTLTVGTISEKVTDAGVAIDGVTLKDGGATFTSTVGGTNITASGTLGVTGNTTVGGTLVNTGLITASAGVAIGGTGSANTLDDYEEGTWTPTLTSSSGSSRAIDSGFKAVYTKIGNNCIAHCVIGIGALTGTNSGTAQLGGLPFNYNGSVVNSCTGSVRFNNVDLPSGINHTTMLQNSSGTSNVFFFSSTFDNTGSGDLGISAFSASSSIVFTLIYQTV